MTSFMLAAESGLTLGQYELSVGAIVTGGNEILLRLCWLPATGWTPPPPPPPTPAVAVALLVVVLFAIAGLLLLFVLLPVAEPDPVAGLLPAFVATMGGRLSVRSECFCICLLRYVSCVYDLPQYWQMCVFRCLDSLCLGMWSSREASSEKHL